MEYLVKPEIQEIKNCGTVSKSTTAKKTRITTETMTKRIAEHPRGKKVAALEKVNLQIPVELYRSVKVISAMEDLRIQQLVHDALADYVTRYQQAVRDTGYVDTGSRYVDVAKPDRKARHSHAEVEYDTLLDEIRADKVEREKLFDAIREIQTSLARNQAIHEDQTSQGYRDAESEGDGNARADAEGQRGKDEGGTTHQKSA